MDQNTVSRLQRGDCPDDWRLIKASELRALNAGDTHYVASANNPKDGDYRYAANHTQQADGSVAVVQARTLHGENFCDNKASFTIADDMISINWFNDEGWAYG